MFILYDLIFVLFSIFYLPILLFRGKAHKGILQRMGIFHKDLIESLRSRSNLWIHAVSVGEAQALSSLLVHLRNDFPLERIVISTVTPTGNRLARSFVKGDELVIYFPLDLSFIVDKFIKIINPKVFITTETEIWPNLFLALRKKNIPVILVNGRISQRSFKGYRLVRLFLRSVFNSIKLFCMQTERDAERIKALGASGNRIFVTGNLKFDAKSPNVKYQLSDLGFKSSDLLLIVGSTHNREEEIIINTYKNLFQEFKNLKLLIAPRHIDRCGVVEGILDRNNIKHVRFSQIIRDKEVVSAIVLDTIGDLGSLYALADVVFMGGSLIKKGGHNIIEPAMFGKPVIFGPFMFNFKDIVEMFLAKNAAIKINNQEELERVLKKQLSDKDSRMKIGELAKKIVEENKGAAEKTVALIKQSLSNA